MVSENVNVIVFDFLHLVAFFFMLWTLPFYNLLTLPLQAIAWWTYFFWYIFQLKSTKRLKRRLKTLHINAYNASLCIFHVINYMIGGKEYCQVLATYSSK
mmetsp:Transcript_14797/g.21896  ORF Transcript_14797/g.21896 Transcript_14797/m.21896 type:complete len:100 (-) Transcript_14797:4446-4745(-)